MQDLAVAAAKSVLQPIPLQHHIALFPNEGSIADLYHVIRDVIGSFEQPIFISWSACKHPRKVSQHSNVSLLVPLSSMLSMLNSTSNIFERWAERQPLTMKMSRNSGARAGGPSAADPASQPGGTVSPLRSRDLKPLFAPYHSLHQYAISCTIEQHAQILQPCFRALGRTSAIDYEDEQDIRDESWWAINC